ncbi:intracellular hyaluronan-binding protein 4 isoform X2 [Coregonus clupeaformis]|uniref:intracellular hyaluronan-binding protein 4 isoform X2 n=1 Tax=Coregonus clupeaformis TaxID=59861 RepID=UPI001BE0175B|nr:intracellular hyaluronan-binding protein 4 isoform X2 [Coregonus clupeaformis]
MKGIIEDPTHTESAGFGCAVTNRFGQLLDDEADPFDIIRQAQVEKQKKKKDELKRTDTTAKPVKKESQKDKRTPLNAGEGDHAQAKTVQGQKYPPRGAPGQVTERGEQRIAFRDRRQNDSEAPLGYSIERPVDQGERAGRGRGGGRGRGMRGNFRSTDGFDQRGKREFERHSGSDRTGVRPEEKRGGSGPRNWGSMRDHMSAAADGAPTEGGDGDEVADSAEAGANRAPETEGEGEAVVEVSVEMSLDEWKALQEQNRPKKEFNLRKADTIVPSDSVVIHKSKKQVEEHVEEVEEEDDTASLRRPANDITAKLKIDFGSLGRPSRGTRGGGRGGRGGPATRPETISPQKPPEKARFQQGQAPNPDDPEDFPALA